MKVQLCSCPARELGASGGMCCLLCDGGILWLFVLLTPWQGRLVLEEKAYDYFKYRHFLFSGITKKWTAKWPPWHCQDFIFTNLTSDAAAHDKDEDCSVPSSLHRSAEVCDRWSLQRNDDSKRLFTVTQCKLYTCAPSLSLCLPQLLFGSGRSSIMVGKPTGRLSLGTRHQKSWASTPSQ